MTPDPSTPLCQLRGIRKAFAGVRALDGVDLEIRAGEIHALVGENGAGKSTLIRILSGVLRPDAGEVRIGGRAVHLRSALAARALGIAVAHQDPQLFLWRSAIENVFNQRGLPGGLLISWREAAREARAALDRLSAGIPGRVPVGLLSASKRQQVALAGALLARPRLLILDEPTAALGARESDDLFRVLRELRSEGRSIIYVSHRLGEVLSLADRVTVLRDGRVTLTADASALSSGTLVEAMVGRQLEPPRAPADPAGAPVALEVSGLSDPQGAFRDVTLSVRRGEIFGLYGLVGAGRTELGQALAGLRPADGRLRASGRAAYLSEDRLLEGNLTGLGIRENLTISALRLSRSPFIAAGKERRLAESLRSRLAIRAPDLEAEIGTLSGGNQQKVLLGRQLAIDPEVLILDEPTQGIDVGARSEIHAVLAGLARSGAAVVLITSDLPEALALSHRLAVMRRGRLVRTFGAGEAGEEEVAAAAFGEEERRDPGESGRRIFRSISRALGMREAALVLTLGAIAGITEVRSPGFISVQNAIAIAANSSGLALAALGQTLLIASGGIDISIGSILALSATAAALWARSGGSAGASMALALLLGAALGAVNAGLSLAGRLHPLITTLGTLGIYRGLLLLWTGGEWMDLPDALLALATAGPFGVPWSVWGVAASAGLAMAYLRWTRLGRACLCAGDNPVAARTHGLPLERARFAAFALLGAGVGLAGVFYTARYGKVQSDTGAGFELPAIAAAVLGGAHVAGGRGTVPGALLGTALIGLLASARVVWGIHERWQLVSVGGLMLFALCLEVVLARLARGRAVRA